MPFGRKPTLTRAKNTRVAAGNTSCPLRAARTRKVTLRRAARKSKPTHAFGACPAPHDEDDDDDKTNENAWWRRAASGTARQKTLGFAHAMAPMRAHCTAAIASGRTDCNMLLIQGWTVRDSCIWCPLQGEDTGGGSGYCRPGNDYGICERSDATMQNVFALNTVGTCGAQAGCNLISALPYLTPLFKRTGAPTAATQKPAPPLPCSSYKSRLKCKSQGQCVWAGKCKDVGIE